MIAPPKPSAVPPILASATLSDNERLALIALVTAQTLVADNGLKGALLGARQIICQKQKYTWALHSGGLVVEKHIKTTQKQTCDLGACSCGARLWCPERALLLVLQSYLSMQEVGQRMTEECSWAQEDVEQEQQVADGLIHIGALRTIDRVAA